MVTCKIHISKILLVLTLLFICVPSVTAVQYVSFAQPDTLTQKDIYLYNASGSLLGLYNTTSTGIELPASGDVMFVIKPQYSTPLDDPGTFLDSGFAYIETNIIPLIIIMALIGFVLTRK